MRGYLAKMDETKKIKIGCLSLVIFFVLIFNITAFVPREEYDWREPDKMFAVNCAEKEVKKKLKCPSSAKFLPYEEVEVGFDKDSNSYTIEGYVDAQNSFGAMIRNEYYVLIQRIEEGKYVLKYITID